MKVVIMAGGKGTRISSVASDIPKPMIKIEGKPVLEHELECLRDQGFTDIIITVSHLGNIIMDYFGDGSGTYRISATTNEGSHKPQTAPRRIRGCVCDLCGFYFAILRIGVKFQG